MYKINTHNISGVSNLGNNPVCMYVTLCGLKNRLIPVFVEYNVLQMSATFSLSELHFKI